MKEDETKQVNLTLEELRLLYTARRESLNKKIETSKAGIDKVHFNLQHAVNGDGLISFAKSISLLAAELVSLQQEFDSLVYPEEL